MGTVFAATFDKQSCFLDVPISVPGHFACLYEMCTVTVRMLTFKQVVCHLSNVFAYILSVATKCVYLSIIWEKKVQVWEFWWENGHVFILLLFLSFFCIMKLMFFFHGTYKCWWTWCLIGFLVFFPLLCVCCQFDFYYQWSQWNVSLLSWIEKKEAMQMKCELVCVVYAQENSCIPKIWLPGLNSWMETIAVLSPDD